MKKLVGFLFLAVLLNGAQAPKYNFGIYNEKGVEVKNQFNVNFNALQNKDYMSKLCDSDQLDEREHCRNCVEKLQIDQGVSPCYEDYLKAARDGIIGGKAYDLFKICSTRWKSYVSATVSTATVLNSFVHADQYDQKNKDKGM